ncbi:MAG TPA: hypothetical protein V6C63_05585, partial [Allocoleopsis sp.]
TASLERIMCEKRCRHLLKMWEEATQAILNDPSQEQVLDSLEQSLDSAFDAEALRFQKLFYDERRYLQELDRQRCVTPADLLEVPQLG